jgi:hypothetical protein
MIFSSKWESFVQFSSQYVDTKFIKLLCQFNWKMNSFTLSGSEYTRFQIYSGCLILLELYLSILASVESTLGSTFSIVLCSHVLATGYNYFGLYNIKVLDIWSSYLVCVIMSGVSMGYVLSLANQEQSEVNNSFYALTLVLAIDAFASLYYLFSANVFCFEKKLLNDESMSDFMLLDNWKGSLFKSSNLKMKAFASYSLLLQLLVSSFLLATLSVTPNPHL